MKHEDTFAYSEARNWLFNDADLQGALAERMEWLKRRGVTEKAAVNSITKLAIDMGWLGFSDGNDMPPISKRSIHYWAREEWADFTDNQA